MEKYDVGWMEFRRGGLGEEDIPSPPGVTDGSGERGFSL